MTIHGKHSALQKILAAPPIACVKPVKSWCTHLVDRLGPSWSGSIESSSFVNPMAATSFSASAIVPGSALAFVAQTLAPSSRTDAVQAVRKSKVRGKKLLLESATTVGLGEETRKSKSKSSRSGSSSGGSNGGANRAARKQALVAATKEVSYAQLLHQHKAWLEYASAALAAPGAASDAVNRLARIDWHGARLRVVRSACAAYGGAEGLVLAETARMLLLLSEQRRVWIPKVGTLVEIQGLDLPPSVLQIEAANRGKLTATVNAHSAATQEEKGVRTK